MNFKDSKNNNFIHLALKGLGKDSRFDKNQLIDILNSFCKTSEGEKMNFDFYKIKPKLSELISSDNKEGKSALGEAFANV